MTRTLLLFVILLTGISFSVPKPAAAFEPLRIVVIGIRWPDAAKDSQASRLVETSLTEPLTRDARVSVIDGQQWRPALAGIGYDGSMNMSREEARRVGAALGCDFFIIGAAETVTRSERERVSHEETTIGLMIVDGRGGHLALFDFIIEKANSAEASLKGAAETLAARAPGYVERLAQFRAARSVIQNSKPAADDPVEEIRADGGSLPAGFSPPEFLNRVKPEYTDEANRAGISATVEAMAVFHRDGHVGEIEIIRWAGYGLDESAARAIRQLKFKPATRDGRPVSVRALIRYNFRRLDGSEKR